MFLVIMFVVSFFFQLAPPIRDHGHISHNKITRNLFRYLSR